ncbi:MAG: hypothetical protein HY904_07445 [Deltaproteobacteria bacterium]|nr:hypothetical protein [Deltaproteobacteria bacterium]
MAETPALTLDQHRAVVAPLRVEVGAIPAEDVREPDMPVPIFLDEAMTSLVAAQDQAEALDAVGLEPEVVPRVEKLIHGLLSAQAIWNAERATGRTEETLRLITQAEDLRQDALETGDLALAKDPEGRDRLSAIREGEGLDDLVADLVDLVVLVTDKRALFAAKKYDVDGTSAAMGEAAGKLRTALAREGATRGASDAKDTRDRIYTALLEPLGELRAHGRHAYRKDRNNTRRAAYLSTYIRRRNLRARAKKASGGLPG